MEAETGGTRRAVHMPTVAALAAIAISVNVAMHEGTHALACVAVGGELSEYTALYVSCDVETMAERRVVAGSAPFVNVLVGLGLFAALKRMRDVAGAPWYLVWLLMLMSLLYGSGYLLFSGVSGIGDMAVVTEGLEPAWLVRAIMVVAGAALFLSFVRLALGEMGGRIGGEPGERETRAFRMALVSYVTSLVVVAAAGLTSSAGFTSAPSLAGIAAVAGGLSPLLWMMEWLRSDRIRKPPGEPLAVTRSCGWTAAGAAVALLYVLVLGRGVV